MKINTIYINIKICILGIFLVPFLCGFLLAAEDSAVLKSMVGIVEYLPNGTADWQKAAEGLKLSQGDKIKTGTDGMASINFTNGSQVMLKPNSEFEIESLDVSQNSVDYKLKLNTGKLRAIVEKMASNSSFTIKTPTAVAAVRGTIYYLNVREVTEDELPADVKERLATDLFVEDGGVLYTNIVSGKYFVVNTSMTSGTYGDGSITVPIEVPEDKRPEWTEGWELLVPEAYESPEGTDLTGLFGEGAGGESDPRLGEKINEVIAAAVALYDERDIIWQEMCRKLLERESLRSTISEILDGNRERRLEGYMEKISDAKEHKVLRDIYGNRVRMEQYILRPDGPEGKVVELLNVNLRANNDLTTMVWATTFNQSLDSLATGQLKTLPWNSYLDTRFADDRGYFINSPYQAGGIYPESMSVMFSHANDAFSESRNFGFRETGFMVPIQRISNQELWVKGFNSGDAMVYARAIEGYQEPGTYSITSGIRNADIAGSVEDNPKGFSYNFADASGNYTINSAFYVMSKAEESMRQDNGKDLAINNIWDALRMNMTEGYNIGNNNLEMVFSSSAFQGKVIDLIYVPFSEMNWQEDGHLPDYSLP